MLVVASALGFALLSPGVASAEVPGGLITTVAGNPTASGLATTIAQNPISVAPISGGAMYVLDEESYSVRELQANGQEPIVAGDGAAGNWGNGGPAAAAAFQRDAEGITVDSHGDLFVADWDDHEVRLVAGYTCSGAANCPLGLTSMTAGDVYVVAGGGQAAYSSGAAATSVAIGYPSGVAVDASGNLLVTQQYGSVDAQVVAATTCTSGASGCPYGFSMTKGDIYTLPGGGTGLNSPRGLAADSSGGVLISDSGNKEAKYVVAATCPSGCFGLSGASAHSIYTIAGGGGTTPANGIVATSANLGVTEGVAFDSRGDALIADQDNAIWLVAVSNCASSCPYGITSMTAGDLYKVLSVGFPEGVTVDASGDVLVPTYSGITVLAEQTCSSGCPYGLSSMTSGDNYVVAGTGTFDSQAGTAAGSAQLSEPASVAVDSAGDTFIDNEIDNEVDVVAAANCASQCPFGLTATTQGDLYHLNTGYVYVSTVAADAAGNALFSNANTNTIEIDPRSSCSSSCPYGLGSTVAGTPAVIIGESSGGSTGSGVPALGVKLNNVLGITTDASGDVILADTDDQLVRMLAAQSCSSQCPFGLGSMTAGYVYTIAGTGTEGPPSSGVLATSTALAYPSGVGTDAAGDVVFAGNEGLAIVAAHSCASGCPYGLASMTAGYIYALANLPYGGNGVAVDSRGDALVAVSDQPEVDLIAASNCTQGCPYGLSSLTAGDSYVVAGNGTAGVSGDGGAASAAELDSPAGIALDAHQNLVIADQYDNRIREVSYAQIDNLQVGLAGAGSGAVSGGGISCGTTCEVTETYGSTVTLTATPAAGSVFSGWSGGGCSGTGSCVTTLAGDETVTASFAPARASGTTGSSTSGTTGSSTSGSTRSSASNTSGSSSAVDAAKITKALKAALGSIGLGRITFASLRAHGFRAVFTGPAAGSVKIVWTTLLGHRRVIIASVSAAFTGQATRHLSAALSTKGRALVRLGERLSVSVSATFAPTVGAAQTLSSRFTVRR